MKNISLLTFLPLFGGFYGAILGSYFHSNNKTPKKKRSVIALGVVCVLLIIAIIVFELSSGE